MTGSGFGTFFALAVPCLALAVLSLWIVARFDRQQAGPLTRGVRSASFRIADGKLTAIGTPATTLLGLVSKSGDTGWAQLRRALSPRFPALPETEDGARSSAPATFEAARTDDAARLHIAKRGSGLGITLDDPVAATVADRHLRLDLTRQLMDIDTVAGLLPCPVWLESASGHIEWANRACSDLLAQTESRRSFPGFDLPLPADSESVTKRAAIEDPRTGIAHWFSVTRRRTPDGRTLGLAIDIDAVIDAEVAQRKFVQTLTKTFAQLSTGLAIFDRERQLVLFNPALIDLLALPAEFLSARPTLLTFFDRLRDNRMMPEPKDYANWRQQITELVIASVDGRFQETWTLPSGLTYRVTGRPHPDGAIALLFEDISAEISLTRRFRSQLTLGQSVIDTLDEAIVVFSSTGALISSNRAFHRLWKMDPGTSFAEVTASDALRQWRQMARPGPFWDKLRTYLADPSDRSEWFSDIVLKDSTAFECRVMPLASGATLIGFNLRPVLEPAVIPAAGRDG